MTVAGRGMLLEWLIIVAVIGWWLQHSGSSLVEAAPRLAQLYVPGFVLLLSFVTRNGLFLRLATGEVMLRGLRDIVPTLPGGAAGTAVLAGMRLPSQLPSAWLELLGFHPLAIRYKLFFATFAIAVRITHRTQFSQWVSGAGLPNTLLYLALVPPYLLLLVMWGIAVSEQVRGRPWVDGPLVITPAMATLLGELARGALPVAGGAMALVASGAWLVGRQRARVSPLPNRPREATVARADAHILWDPENVPNDPTTAAALAAHLRDALNHPEPGVRARAVRGVAVARGDDAVPRLARVLRDDADAAVRLAAAEALAAVDRAEAWAALREQRAGAAGMLAWKIDVLLELGLPAPPPAPPAPQPRVEPQPPVDQLVEIL